MERRDQMARRSVLAATRPPPVPASGMASPPVATASTPAGAPTATPPSRRSIVGRVALLIGIILVVFVGILPRVVDYDAVGAALSSLSPAQLAVLVVATLGAYVANAVPSRVLLPDLGWPRAVASDLAARAVVSTIPGPTDIATRFVLYRQWAIPTDKATSAIGFVTLSDLVSALVLPLIAVPGVLIAGTTVRPSVAWVSLISVGVLGLASLLNMAILRSESFAGRFGDWLQRAADRLWRLFHRTPPSGVAARVLDVRVRSIETLSMHGARPFLAAVGAKLAWFAVLEISLLSVGLTPDVLPPSAVLAAMAAAALVALLPITPGGAGTTEVAYISLLSAVAGEGLSGEITAAVVIFRAAQWLAVIPIGWILLAIMRGSRWRELGADADAATTEAAELPAVV
jgi:putative heme transporter